MTLSVYNPFIAHTMFSLQMAKAKRRCKEMGSAEKVLFNGRFFLPFLACSLPRDGGLRLSLFIRFPGRQAALGIERLGCVVANARTRVCAVERFISLFVPR